MKISPDKSHAYCDCKSCYVRLDQTEGECRDEHLCGDNACPLESALGKAKSGSAFDLMANSIVQSFGK